MSDTVKRRDALNLEVPGRYPNYRVSDTGVVYRLQNNRLVKQSSDLIVSKYYTVIPNDGSYTLVETARLVLSAHRPLRYRYQEELLRVGYRNRDPRCLSLDNLYWYEPITRYRVRGQLIPFPINLLTELQKLFK